MDPILRAPKVNRDGERPKANDGAIASVACVALVSIHRCIDRYASKAGLRMLVLQRADGSCLLRRPCRLQNENMRCRTQCNAIGLFRRSFFQRCHTVRPIRAILYLGEPRADELRTNSGLAWNCFVHERRGALGCKTCGLTSAPTAYGFKQSSLCRPIVFSRQRTGYPRTGSMEPAAGIREAFYTSMLKQYNTTQGSLFLLPVSLHTS